MSMMNQHEAEVAATTAKAAMLGQAIAQQGGVPLSTAISALAQHGGLYTFLNPEMANARLAPIVSALSATGKMPAASTTAFLSVLQKQIASFFIHLVPNKPLKIYSNLISHISFPGGGTAYTPKPEEMAKPADGDSILPAAFTFVGQFIDHDLTANAMDLFVPQTGVVNDEASPLIDLDSVYGPRTKTKPSSQLDLKIIYDSKMRFYLQKYNNGVVDVPRDKCNTALLPDKRNDENQMINQIHQLLMRLHNKFINTKFKNESDPDKAFDAARRETIYTWQSIVMNDYLPKIMDPNLVELKTEAIKQAVKTKDYSGLKHYPRLDPSGKVSVQMPHEFAIGFRFGHSQLRPSYKVNEANNVPLFDNTLPMGTAYSDLRGGQKLQKEHMIDWTYFLRGNGEPLNAVRSKLIDEKVTSVVFDLPESTIPDDIKPVGNLPQRNLIRSDDLGLCAGEDLADLYGVTKLTPEEVEPDAARRGLYMQSGRTFRTPLWYYILREAEVKGTEGRLGPAASNLVAEVVLGGIFYNALTDPTLVIPDGWTSDISGTGIVTLYELAEYVSGTWEDIKSDPFTPPAHCLLPDPVTLTQS